MSCGTYHDTVYGGCIRVHIGHSLSIYIWTEEINTHGHKVYIKSLGILDTYNYGIFVAKEARIKYNARTK